MINDIEEETVELGYYNESTDKDFNFAIEILEAHSVTLPPLLNLDKHIQWITCGFCWLFLLIGSYFRFLLYSFLYGSYKGKDNKPIDVLILVLTLIQHINIALFVIRLTLMFSYEAKLHETVGVWYCTINSLIYLFDVCYSYIGSLGLSLFRILYIKKDLWLRYSFGETKFLYVILFGGLGLATIIVAVYNIHDYMTIQRDNFIALPELIILGQFLDEYGQSRGYFTNFSLWITGVRFVFLGLMAMALAEMALYCIYFHHMYRHDNKESLKRLLGPAVIRKRNRKNAITFFGQFCSFVFEFSISLFGMIGIAGLDVQVPFWAIFFTLKTGSFTVISIVEVLTSRNLRFRIKIPFKRKD